MESWKPIEGISTAVIILNYNGQKHLAHYLPSVVANTPNAEIVIADNGSTDNSLVWLASQPQYAGIKVIDLGKNYGFSGGYNRAIANCPYPYTVLLNSDVETPPNWLEPLVDFLAKHPDVAACQAKLLTDQARTTFEFAGACGGFIDKFGYPFCRGRVFQTNETDNGQYNEPIQIFWGSGACLLIRTEDYRSVGGLDEYFFAHMEEIDLCWRLAHKGRQVWAVPQSFVYHLGGGTLHKSNPRKTFLNFRNGLLLLYKNLPDSKVFPTIFIRLCLDAVAWLQFLTKGEWKNAMAILNAHFAFYGQLDRYHRTRSRIQPPKNADKYIGIYQGSIVTDYFLKGKKTFKEIFVSVRH
jgi:GT2 family glycosyltransferase